MPAVPVDASQADGVSVLTSGQREYVPGRPIGGLQVLPIHANERHRGRSLPDGLDLIPQGLPLPRDPHGG